MTTDIPSIEHIIGNEPVSLYAQILEEMPNAPIREVAVQSARSTTNVSEAYGAFGAYKHAFLMAVQAGSEDLKREITPYLGAYAARFVELSEKEMI